MPRSSREQAAGTVSLHPFYFKNSTFVLNRRIKHRSQRWEKTNLPQLRALLRPADESVFISLSVCEAIDLRVRAQRAFVVNVAAIDSPNTHCVH